jgi:TRAP-type transport system periplasmic protein
MSRRLSRRGLLGALGALGVPAGLPLACRAADSYTLRLNITIAANSVQGVAAVHLAQALNRRSNGQIKVELYPNNQLAKESDIAETLVSGVLDMAIVELSTLFPLLTELQVFNMPFLFKNFDTAFRVLDGPIGDGLFVDLAAKGVSGLSWGTSGFKELETTNKAVVVPDDMKGMRIRIQHSPVYVAIYQALGAIPVVIDMSESYVALTQHTVDALEITLDAFTTGKFYAVAKHVAMMNHIFAVTPLVMSRRKLESMPVALQKMVREEGKAAIQFWRSNVIKQTNDDVLILKQNGVAFTEVQYPLFRKQVEPIYALVQKTVGGNLIERVNRATGVS